MTKSEPPPPTTHPALARPMVAFVRSMIGFAPSDAMQHEDVATLGQSFPSRVDALDTDGWIAWCLVGLTVFAMPPDGPAPERSRPRVPSLRVATREARRLVLAMAMLRYDGNITHVARALGTSRRSAREQLKAAGLYPWDRAVGMPTDDGETHEGAALEIQRDGGHREGRHDGDGCGTHDDEDREGHDGEADDENGGDHVL